jgi:hypothetical protein
MRKPKLKLCYNEYVATLRKQDKQGRWRKISTIGNTGVAFDFVKTLENLGFIVILEPHLLNEN